MEGNHHPHLGRNCAEETREREGREGREESPLKRIYMRRRRTKTEQEKKGGRREGGTAPEVR